MQRRDASAGVRDGYHNDRQIGLIVERDAETAEDLRDEDCCGCGGCGRDGDHRDFWRGQRARACGVDGESESCRTVQFEWSVMDTPVPAMTSFRIHHRAILKRMRGDRVAAAQACAGTGQA